jgi:hypothetical protein
MILPSQKSIHEQVQKYRPTRTLGREKKTQRVIEKNYTTKTGEQPQ